MYCWACCRRTADELQQGEGPLAELAFWTSRTADLGGINLADPGLQHILLVLEAAKSPYLPTFLALGNSIQLARTSCGTPALHAVCAKDRQTAVCQ